jgi:hypothetical protein
MESKTYEIRVMYVRDRKNNPVGCIAMRRSDADLARFVEFAYSVSSEPTGYSRKLGSKIAINRLTHPAMLVPKIRLMPEETSSHSITAAVMEEIVSDIYAPSKVRNFAKRWLKERDARVAANMPATSPSEKMPAAAQV